MWEEWNYDSLTGDKHPKKSYTTCIQILGDHMNIHSIDHFSSAKEWARFG